MGIRCLFGHSWSACICERCGKRRKTRNTSHVWNGCKCEHCGRVRNIDHDWSGCVCERCGRKRDEGHDLEGDEKDAKRRCRVCGKVKSPKYILCPDCGVYGYHVDPMSVSYGSGTGTDGDRITCSTCNGTSQVRKWL